MISPASIRSIFRAFILGIAEFSNNSLILLLKLQQFGEKSQDLLPQTTVARSLNELIAMPPMQKICRRNSFVACGFGWQLITSDRFRIPKHTWMFLITFKQMAVFRWNRSIWEKETGKPNDESNIPTEKEQKKRKLWGKALLYNILNVECQSCKQREEE